MGSISTKCVSKTVDEIALPGKKSAKHYISGFSKIKHSDKKTSIFKYEPFSYRNMKNEDKKYIVYSHGNCTNLEEIYNFLQQIADQNNACIIGFDYQGYGLSSGSQAREKDVYEDINVVMEHLYEQDIQKKNITLIGRSIGTGVTVNYAYKNEWQYPIILISPCKTAPKIAIDKSALNLISVNSIDKFHNERKIRKLNCPIKIYHGDKDTIINVKHGKDLDKLIKNKKYKITIMEGYGHNNIVEDIFTKYQEEIEAIIHHYN